MARKIKDIIIATGDPENRDEGKTYRLTEMAALQAEKLGWKVAAAIGKSGVDIPDEVRHRGIDAIFTVGMKSFVGVDFVDAEPIMDEIMECATFLPVGNDTPRQIFPGDIEEITTILKIRQELVELHTGFFIKEGLWKIGQIVAEWMEFHYNIRISRELSEPLLDQELPAGQNLEQPLV